MLISFFIGRLQFNLEKKLYPEYCNNCICTILPPDAHVFYLCKTCILLLDVLWFRKSFLLEISQVLVF